MIKYAGLNTHTVCCLLLGLVKGHKKNTSCETVEGHILQVLHLHVMCVLVCGASTVGAYHKATVLCALQQDCDLICQ